MLEISKTKKVVSVFQKKFLIPFFTTLSIILLFIFQSNLFIGKTNISSILYFGIIFSFISIFIWYKDLERTNLYRRYIDIICSVLFISSLLTITIQNFIFQFIKINYLNSTEALTLVQIIFIFTGFIVFYNNNNNNPTTNNPTNSKVAKKTIFEHVLSLIKSNKTIYFLLLIISICIFITIKLYMVFTYNGSFSDEYYHITSGLEFIHTGHFAEIYTGERYTRESYFSVLVGLSLIIFGKTLFAAKLVPLFIGIVNLFLLIYIASKLFIQKYSVILLILSYSFFPWVIFDHFYVRFYVFLEFIILLITALFIKYIQNKQRKYLYIIFLINILFLIFYRGASSNLINAFSFSLLFSNIIFMHIKEVYQKIFLFKKFLYYGIFLIFCTLYLSSNFILNSFNELFYGQLKYANSDLNYYKFFFSLNFILTALVFFSLSHIFRSKNAILKSLFLAFVGLATLHFFSNPDSQTIRAIFYLMPLYLLFSIYFSTFVFSIKNEIFGFKYIISALLLLNVTITVLKNYPPNFFSFPYIHTEIMYYDSSIYPVVNEKCALGTIITANRPDILEFYNLHSSYYLNTQYNIEDWVENDPESKYSFYNEETKTFYYTNTKTPVIFNVAELSNIVNALSGRPVCIVTGLMPYAWIDQTTRDYINTNFILIYEGISSTEKNALRLYIKS